MVAVHTAIAIVLAIGLIIKVKVDPVISLILASLYLGLASGVGFTGTIEAIATGFGEIMAEVGLLIGFGVLIGALLHSSGAFHRLVDVLVRVWVPPGCRTRCPPCCRPSSRRSTSTCRWCWRRRWPARPRRTSAATGCR